MEHRRHHRTFKQENFVVFGLVVIFLLIGVVFTSLWDHRNLKPQVVTKTVTQMVTKVVKVPVAVPGPTETVYEPYPVYIIDKKGSGGVRGHWCRHHRYDDPKCHIPVDTP